MRLQYTKNGTRKVGTAIRAAGMAVVVSGASSVDAQGLQSSGSTELVFPHEAETEDWNKAYYAVGGVELFDEEGDRLV